jgi:N-acetylglucosaminyl-diphospho-decaprenol L-rhamnosyltransferase
VTASHPSSASTVDVSIVTVNYKVAELALRMVRSVPAAVRGLSSEVVVVDNASADGSVVTLRGASQAFRLVESDENLGFAAGNNLGAREARGRFVALVNPDVVLDAGSLEHLVHFLSSHPRVGMVGPRIVLPDGTTQSFAGRLPDSWTVLGTLPGATLVDRSLRRVGVLAGEPNEPTRCGVLHGSCMVFSRAAWDAIGGVPTDTFMYGEEHLIGHRLAEAGFEVWYDPRARVRHDHESSANQEFSSHPKAIRKRQGHIVALRTILPRPSFVAWNAVLAARSLASCVKARLSSSGTAREHWDFVRLHVGALAAPTDSGD